MMVLREFLVPKVPLETMVRWVLRVHKGFRVMMVLREFLAHKALLELMELLGHFHLVHNLAR
jgi:hypothetical protein